MDKIDVVLFRYKKERKNTQEINKAVWKVASPMILVLLIYIMSFFLYSTVYKLLIAVFSYASIFVWSKFAEGKWGTKKWKYKRMNNYRDIFMNNQRILFEIIKDEGLNCQQVYNILVKKYNRLPCGTDKQSFIITIFSLVLAFVGVLTSPLESINNEQYAGYIITVFLILIILAPMGYILYKVFNAQNKQYDEEKKHYRYILELLEDYLY